MARVNIEIPDDLHREAKVYCAANGITLIEFIKEAIEKKVNKK
jgi:predicted HicB family RNase H-like nuclease